MNERSLPQTIKECNIIIKKCRKQLANAQGMSEACRLMRVGKTIDEVEAAAYDHKRKYHARLNEIVAHKSKLLNQMMEDDDYDI